MKKTIALLICSFLIICSFLDVSATVASADGQPFSVRPILPDNQDKNITNYISITTNEKKISQEIQFIITNKTNHALKVKVSPVNALTSPNGVIQYLPTLKETNSEITKNLYGLKQYVKNSEKTVELKPSENKIVKLDIAIPKMNGTILGGINFQTINEGSKGSEDQFSINNEINNIIGVRFNFPTNDQPEFIIGTPFIDQMPALYALRLPITNDSSILLKDISLDYEVWDYKGEKVFGADKIDYVFNFAPNTKANIAIPWDHEKLSENKTYKITGEIKYQGENYPFEKEFTFKNEADTYSAINHTRPTIDKDWTWLLITLGMLTGIVMFLLWKRRRFVLPSINAECAEEIFYEDALYQSVIPFRELKHYEGDYSYLHFYRKTKKSQGANDGKVRVYKYRKTIRKEKAIKKG